MPRGSRNSDSRLLRALLLLALPLCFSLTTQAEAAKLSSPSKLVHDYDARVAVAGDGLWLASLGTDKRGRYRIETQRRTNGKWTTLPRLATLYEKGHQFAALTPSGGATVPCVGDSPRDQGRIRCFRERRWQKMELDPSLTGMVVTGLKAEGPTLTASFARWNPDGSTTIAVGRAEGDAISPVGPPLELDWRALSYLGTQTSDVQTGVIDLSVETYSGFGDWAAAVTSLDAGTRSEFQPVTLPENGQAAGPVRSADGLFLAIGEHRSAGDVIRDTKTGLLLQGESGWTRVTDEKVGSGQGYNFGGAHPVGSRVWFTWVHARVVKKNRILTQLQAARVSSDSQTYDRKIVLVPKNYSHNYLLPQAVQYRGRPVFLYQRTVAKGRWRATLDFSHR